MTKFDDMAWEEIARRRPPEGAFADHKGLAKSGRPKNFIELETAIREGDDFSLAFRHFLDEFYCFKSEDFFDLEPARFFTPEVRAWLAGTAEYLCRRFSLRVPEWVEEPEYFLPKPWSKSHDDTGEPAFSRRNVLFNPRHLIRL